MTSKRAKSQLFGRFSCWGTAVACVAGIAGTVTFIASWAVLGARLRDYSPVVDTISEMARVSRDTHGAMTIAIATFGITTCVFSYALLVKSPLASIVAFAHGASAIGVAMTPVGTSRGESFHDLFAGAAYISLTLLPLVAIAKNDNHVAVLLARGTSVFTGMALLMSVFGPSTTAGMFQRFGLTAGDMWIIATAVVIGQGEGSKSAGSG